MNADFLSLSDAIPGRCCRNKSPLCWHRYLQGLLSIGVINVKHSKQVSVKCVFSVFGSATSYYSTVFSLDINGDTHGLEMALQRHCSCVIWRGNFYFLPSFICIWRFLQKNISIPNINFSNLYNILNYTPTKLCVMCIVVFTLRKTKRK